MANARRAQYRHPIKRCVDCNTTNVRAEATYGWLCDPCWKKRSDAESAFAARMGGMLMQPMDPDGPPQPCGCEDCRRDSVMCVRVFIGTPNEVAVGGCEEHASDAMVAASRLVTSSSQ